VSLHQQRKAMFNALLYRKHPRLYRERIQPGPPWHYYGMLAAAGAAGASALRGSRGWALGASVAWLLLEARFCRRRLQHTSSDPRHVAEMILTSALIPFVSVFWRLYGALKFRVWFL
jgi:hypothetical protein